MLFNETSAQFRPFSVLERLEIKPYTNSSGSSQKPSRSKALTFVLGQKPPRVRVMVFLITINFILN